MKNKFKPKSYINISYDDLVVYALFELQRESKHTTFENLVAKTFEFFPKRFQLPGYPDWPDSSLIEKSWVRCRTDKGLMYGSKSKGFTLTPKGIALAKNVKLRLQGKTTVKDVQYKGDARTRSGRLVKHIEKSPAFQKYNEKSKLDNITEFEFCDLLYSTFDTDSSLRKRNLEELKYHAEVYERKDIINFLKKCEEKFENLLKDPITEEYEGGMMKRRKGKKK